MKKLISILFIFLLTLTLFTGCSGNFIFSENKNDDGSLPVKELTVGIFNNAEFTDVGNADKSGFYLSRRCLNGYSEDEGSCYVYSSVENFEEVTKGAKGIVIYRGLAYAVTEENGSEYLTVISDHAANYQRKYEANQFKNMAVNFVKEYGNTVSGGDGLLYNGKNTSG